ncbi:uncharacterized protein VTP21DRAFT_9839 [Calcarisporiella thermophila]|uniref:uncharacterized protein n=1 Tax=Calcarisporiella thermophila TaxID=911321 RepID=UPI003743E683
MDIRSRENDKDRTPPSLSYFCIYNPTLGTSEETSKDQLLYYAARKAVPLDAKLKQVGLAQALVNFTRVFSQNKPCENVHTQKNRLVFLEAEPGFWIHMCIELGQMKKQGKDSSGKPKVNIEYLDHELQDVTIRAALEQAYQIYKLFNGSFESTIRKQSIKHLQHRLEDFFGEWIWKWDFDSLDTHTALDGIFYQPLSRNTHNLLSLLFDDLQREFAMFSTFMVLSADDALVFSGLKDVCDSRNLWHHVTELTCERRKQETAQRSKKTSQVSTLRSITKTFSSSNLFGSYWYSAPALSSSSSSPTPESSPAPPTLNPPVKPDSAPPAVTSSLADPLIPSESPPERHGYYLVGPKVMDARKKKIGLTRVYLAGEIDETEALTGGFGTKVNNEMEHFLIVYGFKSQVTLAFLIPCGASGASEQLSSPEFYHRLDSYLGPRLLDIVAATTEDSERVRKMCAKPDREYRYILFNRINLGIRSSIGGSKHGTVNAEMVSCINRVKADLEVYGDLNEVYVRTSSSFYVAGRRTEDREVYIVVPRKDASLVDVEEDMRKVCSYVFMGTFLD